MGKRRILNPASYSAVATLPSGEVHIAVEWYEKVGTGSTVFAELKGILRIGSDLHQVRFIREHGSYCLLGDHLFTHLRVDECEGCENRKVRSSAPHLHFSGRTLDALQSNTAHLFADHYSDLMNPLEAEILASVVAETLFAAGDPKAWPDVTKVRRDNWYRYYQNDASLTACRTVADSFTLFGDVSTDYVPYRESTNSKGSLTTRIRLVKGALEVQKHSAGRTYEGDMDAAAVQSIAASMGPDDFLRGYGSTLKVYSWTTDTNPVKDGFWFNAMQVLAKHTGTACSTRTLYV